MCVRLTRTCELSCKRETNCDVFGLEMFVYASVFDPQREIDPEWALQFPQRGFEKTGFSHVFTTCTFAQQPRKFAGNKHNLRGGMRENRCDRNDGRGRSSKEFDHVCSSGPSSAWYAQGTNGGMVIT